MSSMQQPIVKQATAHFEKGDYSRARACYQKAGEVYGTNLFANSIRLCELRMGNPVPKPVSQVSTAAAKPNTSAKPPATTTDTEKQLAETQSLLEHYYTRCQELEYQLLDRK